MSALPDDRRRAIAQSGWGAEFRLFQPHNLAFWVYGLLVVVGILVLLGQVSIALAAYSGALVSGIVVFSLLAAAYLRFIRRTDRYTTVPPKLAGAGFVWGFFAATGAFAMVANDAVISLYTKAFGASFASDWGAALAAPINEEVAKGAGILLLLTLAPRLIRSPFDGLILGAFVGIGFQISEDISYAWIGSANSFGDIGAAWQTIGARLVVSLTSHWAFSAIFGAGLIWFIGRPEAPARKWLGAGLMVTAMLAHGLWNASSAIGGDTALGWIVPLIVAVMLISVLVWIYNNSEPVERDWMRQILAPEVKRGVVTPEELEALAGPRSALRDHLRSQPNRRSAKHVLAAETDLAHRIAHEDGAETPAVQQARAAVAEARRRASVASGGSPQLQG